MVIGTEILLNIHLTTMNRKNNQKSIKNNKKIMHINGIKLEYVNKILKVTSHCNMCFIENI